MRTTLLLSLLLLLFPLRTPLAQDRSAPPDAGAIDRLLTTYHAYGLFNGTALVAAHGQVVLKKGYGMANMEWDVPHTPDTKFRLGSITKQFTAALILQLVQEGKLALDDPITKHLPDYPADPGDRVTIHHLLTHTTCSPSYTGRPEFSPETNPFSTGT